MTDPLAIDAAAETTLPECPVEGCDVTTFSKDRMLDHLTGDGPDDHDLLAKILERGAVVRE